MRVPYFPGCSLKDFADNFEKSAFASASVLGVELVELPEWYCCGVVAPLEEDELIRKVAPARNFLRTKELGGNKLVTLCSMCYNTLKLTNLYMKKNPDKLERINSFMDEEENYDGTVEVIHFLELLRDSVSFEKIREKVKKPLKGLKVAPYYGCLLLRPKEVAIDSLEKPTVMEDLLKSLGAEIVNSPLKKTCCGSYQVINNKEVASKLVYKIITAVTKRGGEAVVTSCPLCHYNLDSLQKDLSDKYPGYKEVPVFYFTQLMALAFGLEEEVLGLEKHEVNPLNLLKSKGLI